MEDENSIEFIAYSRLLLRSLQRVKKAIISHDTDTALCLIDEIIEDTLGDIEL